MTTPIILIVEDDDLRVGVLEPLQREEAEERRLPRPGRPENERVPHVADVQVQAKWRIARGAAGHVRGAAGPAASGAWAVAPRTPARGRLPR